MTNQEAIDKATYEARTACDSLWGELYTLATRSTHCPEKADPYPALRKIADIQNKLFAVQRSISGLKGKS